LLLPVTLRLAVQKPRKPFRINSMDLNKIIADLRLELERVENAIAMLEPYGKGSPQGNRRGRKTMSESERKEVSNRMRRYWENRLKTDAE